MKENKIFDETDVFRKSKSKRVKNNNKYIYEQSVLTVDGVTYK